MIVRRAFLYISLPYSSKQQRKMTNFQVLTKLVPGCSILPPYCTIGSFSNDDGNGNENVM